MPRKISLPALALCALALVSTPAVSASLSTDLQRALRAPSGSTMPVIVQTHPRLTRGQKRDVQRLIGRSAKEFRILPAFTARLSAAQVVRLSRQSAVQNISLDQVVSASADRPSYRGPFDWSARAVGAPQAWNLPDSTTGRGVGVAVLDTGLVPGPELPVAGWVDLVNGRTEPYDDNGHGTHVAGILAGNGCSSGGTASPFRGVAPESRIIGVKVLDASAQGTTSGVIRGLEWCIVNQKRFNIRVINLSLGQDVAQPSANDPLCQACDQAVAAGMVVVVSAGNAGGGYGGITAPGNAPSVITVGAMKTSGTPRRSDDGVALYSGRGPTALDGFAKPDILAPGNRVVSLRAPGSTLDNRCPQNRVMPHMYRSSGPARYFVLSGTSMAAPVVSGICALMLENHPQLAPNAVKAAVMLSAEPAGGYDPVLRENVERYDWLTQGAGYVNAPGAVRVAEVLAVAASGQSNHLPALVDLPAYDVFPDESVLWGNSIVWGGSVLWGNSPLLFDALLAQPTARWGESLAWSPDVTNLGDPVQATSVLWGNYPARRTVDKSVLVYGEGGIPGAPVSSF